MTETNKQLGQPHEEHNPQPYKGKRKKPVFIRIYRSIKRCAYKYKAERRPQMSDHSRNERAMVRWTAVVGAAAVMSAFIALKTCQILKVTDETARTGERAFIGVMELATNVVGSDQNNIYYRISLDWENSGTTVPKELQLYFGQIIGKEIPEAFPDLGTGTHFVLLPKQSFSVGDLIVNGNRLNNMRGGAGQIKAFGMAKYRDAFNDRHLTMVCYDVIVNPVLDYNRPDSKVSGQPCVKYNCIDTECSRYAGEKTVADALEYLKDR